MQNYDLLIPEKFEEIISNITDKKEIRRLTNFRNFLVKAREVHGDKYDYSKVMYINTYTKIEIICKTHGSFFQLPQSHLSGSGCLKCFIDKCRKTKEQFVSEANEIHSNKYDYSLVEYVNSSTLVKIICPIHGGFEQTPEKHICSGHGCPKCGKSQRKTTYEFIKDARKIHGDFFDYSLVDYVNAKTPVKIICPIHGVFEQTPDTHLTLIGHGCPKCFKHTFSTEDFIQLSKSIHGDKYDYSLVQYVNVYTKVQIICPKHGVFWQWPHAHIYSNCGCQKCAQELQNSKLHTKLYNYLIEHNIKIETEKTFKWLKRISNLRLDFFLPEYNIAIEVQGIQHFKETIFFENDFKDRQECDTLKYQLCKEHGIKIYYIAEKEYVKDYDFGHLYTNIEKMINDIKEGTQL